MTEIVNNLKKQLQITTELMQKGMETAKNYLLLKVEARKQKVNATGTYQTFRDNLFILDSACGTTDTQFVKIEPVQLEITPPVSKSNFTLKYTIDSLEAVTDQLVFENKYNPQFKLFMNAGLNAVELEGIQRKFGFSAGVNFSLTLFDGMQESFNRQQNEIQLKTINSYKKNSLKNIAVEKQKSLSNKIYVKKILMKFINKLRIIRK